MSKDHIKFSCTKCGSGNFIFPNDPPQDDDVVICSGCKREVGSWASIREATVAATKAEIDEAVVKAFGKKLDWK